MVKHAGLVQRTGVRFPLRDFFFIQIVESGQEKNGAAQTLAGKQLNRANGKLQNEVLVDA